MHGDPTWSIPDGGHMVEFAARMYDDPEGMNADSDRRVDWSLEYAAKLNAHGHLHDGFTLCSDYCFNVNPFFSPDKFDELIVPFLKRVIDGYRELGYYTIKHTDGNIMPIAKQMADCGPDAFHSLDPQGGVSIPELRKIIGDKIALVGNVNCGLLQDRQRRGVPRRHYALALRGHGAGLRIRVLDVELRVHRTSARTLRDDDRHLARIRKL